LTTYHIGLAQGPLAKRTPVRKTVVHTLDTSFLGCTVGAKSEEDALAAAPNAIEVYRRWLKIIGEDAPTGDIKLDIIERAIDESSWGGRGFMSDFQADLSLISPAEVEYLVRRYEAMTDFTAQLLASVSPIDLTHKPDTGRSLHTIVFHILGAGRAYLMSGVGSVGTPQPHEDAPWLAEWDRLTTAIAVRLRAMTDEERERVIYRGQAQQTPWTARKALRRLLEHTWEHTQEIATRLERPL
jgi:hypothetical protein